MKSEWPRWVYRRDEDSSGSHDYHEVGEDPIAAERELRVLVVVPAVPYPPIWGFAQRAFQLARHTAYRQRVTILCYANADQEPDVRSLSPFVDEVVAVVRPHTSRVSKRLAQVESLGSRIPYHARGLASGDLQRALDALLREKHFDIVQLESSQLGWLRIPHGTPVVVDEHNIESEVLHRMVSVETSLSRRVYNRVESLKYRRFEESTWRTSSGCVVTSHRDADNIRARRPGLPVTVVPNSVDPDYFAPTGQSRAPNRLVFTGILNYRPNSDGILWFINDVLPQVKATHPDVELVVVGAADEAVAERIRRPGVVVTGRVPDLRPYMDTSAVVIVPLRMGGGTRLKVVEAMSMGAAIVSTTLGIEGIDVTSEELLVADTASEFAQSVRQLLDDRSRRDVLGANARRVAVEKYSWARAASVLEDFYRNVLGQDSTPGPETNGDRR